jgi:hypothetical protein
MPEIIFSHGGSIATEGDETIAILRQLVKDDIKRNGPEEIND